MQIHFQTSAIATRAVKRIKRELGISESTSRQWTAFVLGYKDWHEFEAALRKHPPSTLDEDCSPVELSARREFQAERLARCFEGSEAPHPDPRAFVGAWRPSAARPQEMPSAQAVPTTSDRAPEFAQFVLMLYDGRARASDKLDWLIPQTRDCTDIRLLKLVAGAAAKAIQKPDAREKAAARRILEVLSSKDGLPLAWFNLATSLMLGDGGPRDDKRAGDLLRKVAEDGTSPEISARAQSLLASQVALGAGRPADLGKAMSLWEKAADAGDTEAAFNLALALEGSNRQFAATARDLPRAVKYYRQAASAGHAHAATNLGLLLMTHLEMEEQPMESLHWLSRGQELGDPNAAAALTALDQKADKVLKDMDAGRIDPKVVREMQEHMFQMLNKGKR